MKRTNKILTDSIDIFDFNFPVIIEDRQITLAANNKKFFLRAGSNNLKCKMLQRSQLSILQNRNDLY